MNQKQVLEILSRSSYVLDKEENIITIICSDEDPAEAVLDWLADISGDVGVTIETELATTEMVPISEETQKKVAEILRKRGIYSDLDDKVKDSLEGKKL